MRVVYVDTGAFIALIWQRDRAHPPIRKHFLELRKNRDLLVTSDPVIGETVTRLRYDAGLAAAMAFRRVIEEAEANGALRIPEVDQKLRTAAFDIMGRYSQLRLSYADCVGAAVAREVRADGVFGLDHDFQVMGFRLEPAGG